MRYCYNLILLIWKLKLEKLQQFACHTVRKWDWRHYIWGGVTPESEF